jgi:hypothetical protein
MKAIAVVLLAIFLTAYATSMPASAGPVEAYTVQIFWKTDKPCEVNKVEEEKTTCKKDDSAFCVARNDFIIWQSNNPSNAKYEIYFDPIQGMPLKAGQNGKLVKQIDDNAPLADYKYSIVREGCAPDLANTYDPRIRVDK